MAFEWHWQPTLDEELSRKARASMEGYRPLQNPTNDYAMQYGTGHGPFMTVADVAAHDMAGYSSPSIAMMGYTPSRAPDSVAKPADPSFGLGGEGAIDRGRMFGANNYGQGMAYLEQQAQAQEQLEALRAEYAANAQKIQQLKMELVSLNEASGKYMDDLDMRLAANRAGIGDMGTAMAHQNRIVTRQLLENAKNSSTSSADKAALDLVSSFIDTESAMMMGDNSQRPGFQNKLNFLQYQIDHDPKAQQLLAKFRGSTGGGPLEQQRTFQDFTNFVSDKRTGNASNAVKKNGLTVADKEDIDEFWYSLPKDVREANKEAYNAIRGEEDIETVQKRGATLGAKQQAAVDEAANPNNIRLTDLDDKGSYEYTATNGQKVTVTRSKYREDGKMDIVIKCGRKTKTITR